MHYEYWYNYDHGICCVLGEGVLFCWLTSSSDLNWAIRILPKRQVRMRKGMFTPIIFFIEQGF